jgi:hypothetical protein
MGVTRLKRRKQLVVWAWRNRGYGSDGLVSLSTKRPKRQDDDSYGHDYSVGICVDVFRWLSGDVPTPGAKPIKVRIPPWTVLKGIGKTCQGQ